jgi:hypothetical protein
LITADLPGSGKSACFSAINKDEHSKVLFVCPVHELRRTIIDENDFDSVTLSSFIGERIDTNSKVESRAFDYSAYKYIVFDELYQYRKDQLKAVYKITRKEKNVDKLFFATGDNNQLQAIDQNNEYVEKVNDHNQRVQKIINFIFPTNMNLTQLKRIKCSSCVEQNIDNTRHCKECIVKRDKYTKIYTQLKNNDFSALKNFNETKKFEDIKTLKNIVYTHKVSNRLNQQIFKQEHPTQDDIYFVGNLFRCLKTIKKKAQ